MVQSGCGGRTNIVVRLQTTGQHPDVHVDNDSSDDRFDLKTGNLCVSIGLPLDIDCGFNFGLKRNDSGFCLF